MPRTRVPQSQAVVSVAVPHLTRVAGSFAVG